MQVPSLMERRKVSAARRRKMSGVRILEFQAGSDGSHGPESGPYPEELKLECTHDNGRVTDWFDDHWWLESLRRWKDVSLAIHVLPTPEALLNPVVIHEFEMVRRLQTPWKLVGHCYLSDVAHASQLPRLAVNPYDEIRIIDAQRDTHDSVDIKPATLTFQEIYDQVRQLQEAEKVVTPLLTRVPLPRGR